MTTGNTKNLKMATENKMLKVPAIVKCYGKIIFLHL